MNAYLSGANRQGGRRHLRQEENEQRDMRIPWGETGSSEPRLFWLWGI